MLKGDGGRMLLVGALLLLTACGSAAGPSTDPEARPGTHLPSDRLELPELGFQEFQTLLGELQGGPVVVNIWASWCPPCFVEAPELAQVSREFEGRVQFLGVDILDDRQAARKFIRRFDWRYPSVFDPDGEIRDRLGYIGQPITVLYDRGGDVAFEWTGTITADLLRAEIRKVLDV
jgi:cytochrome c biogenesis protein CcmG, thiol:disulfide interchange protein DsbE